ncbi:MAG TPA: AsmA family protein, partial [Anaeromyxobacteraceae bacterium]|nr:AsmA family protein [Anaeromyxobacteraceae bacterium]
GEARPMLELDRAEVKLALLRALTSAGKDVRVRSAELQGLRAAVIRSKDGKTNLDRLTEAMARNAPAEKPAEKPPEEGAKPADMSMIRVEHAAVLDARIAFVDEAAGGAELYVGDVDVVVDGLAAGAPLDVTLKAGVLSAKQNLELKVHAPPLPPTLVPSPDHVVLKVQPVDLTPLAPFAPRQAGFQGGHFTSDLDVALGAAVPGGSGPTAVRGGFAATGLRFEGQEGGKALDVRLDADLTADMTAGELSISRLFLSFGPAGLDGKGKVSGLLSESPRVEGLRIASRNLDLAALTPYYPPLRKMLGGTMAGPVGLVAEAAGTADKAALELRADLTPVRMSFPDLLEKAAGGKLLFVARLRGGAAGALRFDAEGDMTGLDLRPGGSLAKKPGDRFTFVTTARRSVSGKTQKLELASFAMALLDMNVKARGTTELAPRSTRFDLAAEIDRVDVDRLLLPSKPEKAAPQTAAKAKPTPASAYAGIAGKASLRIGQVIAQKQKMTDVRVAVAMKEDEVTVQEGRLGLWDGVLSVAGTRARLAPADMPFDLAAKMEKVSVEGALAAFTDKKVLSGRMDADVKLSGRGEDADRIKKSLDGTIEGKLLDGAFHGKDLIGEVTGPIAKAIPALGSKVTTGGTTKLGKVLPLSLRVQNGKATLQKPLEFEDRGAAVKAQGGFTLDGELDLPVTLTLSPAAATDLTGGKANMDALPFGFKLVGKAWSPRVSGLDVGPAVKAIGAKLATAAVGKVLGTPAAAAKEKAQEKVQDATKALQEGAAKKLKGLFGR